MARFEHQERAFQKVIYNFERGDGIILIIDPGLGKTRISIDAFSEVLTRKHVDSMVVIYPKGVQTVWIDELKKWFDKEYKLFVYDAIKKDGIRFRKDFEDTLETTVPVIYLFNTEAFQVPNQVLEYFLKQIISKKRSMLVLDECSYIKNEKAKRTKNILSISKWFKYKVALTGTEMTKSLLDIYPQFEFVKENIWNMRFYAFKMRYAVMQKQSFYRNVNGVIKRVEFDEVVGFKNTKELFDKIEPYSIRIKKEDCFDLPEKIHIDVPITLDHVARKFYDDFKRNAIAMISDNEESAVIACTNTFSKLRQITGGWILNDIGNPIKVAMDNAKMQYLLADLEGHDKQAIIWAVHRHEVEFITKELSKLDTTVYFMGNMGDDVRADAVHKFQSGAARFFVANPYACGFGINLQNAYLMYYYSMPTSLEVLLQSQDRIHRSGQKNDCVYKYLIAKNTVDESIRNNNDLKEQLRQAFIHKDIAYLEKVL